MAKKLFLIFNHQITSRQVTDARESLKVEQLVPLPDELKQHWCNIPPHAASIKEYIAPVIQWLTERAVEGDYVLIQGDFGACYILVNAAFEHKLVPIYSTTHRQAVETRTQEGGVDLIHQFLHQRFREYEKQAKGGE